MTEENKSEEKAPDEKATPSAEPKTLGMQNAPSRLPNSPGTRRVNNLPVYLGAVVILGFLLIVGVDAADRAQPQQTATETIKEKPGDSMQLAQAVVGSQVDGVIPAENPPQQSAANSDTAIPIALSNDALSDKIPPIPPHLQGNVTTSTSDPEVAQIHQQKMQLFEAAVRSKTGVSLPQGNLQRTEVAAKIGDNQQADLIQSDDPNIAFQARLAQLQHGGGQNGSGQLLAASTPSTGNLKQFDNNGKGNRWALDQQVEVPPTPYTLRAGFIIPATLISGINSDLPGQIIGQVSQNVYDTATGRYLLIPQGSRLVGSYSNDVSYGQSRVLVAWQRIVFPNGNTLDIGAMPGADGIGEAGFEDQTNNHYLRIFGSAILMSGISAGVAISQDHNANSIYSQPTTSSVISESLGQQLGTTATQMINKNLNISPTLEIRPGFRFNVMCVKDLVLTQAYATQEN